MENRRLDVIGEAPVTVEELQDRAAIAALAPDWQRLRREVATAGGPRGPFHAPTWTAVYAAHLAASGLKLLVAHRAGRLTGVLPLFIEKRRLAGAPADTATALALSTHLQRDRSWDVLELRDAPVDGAALDPLVDALVAAGHPSARWSAMSSPTM